MTYLVLASVLKGVIIFLQLYSWLIVISAALTMFTRVKDKPSRVKLSLKKLVDPVNDIFRGLLGKLGGNRMYVDLSPLLSLIFIWVISGLLTQLVKYLYHFTY